MNKISAHVRNLKRSTYAGLALVFTAVLGIPLITTAIVGASASGGLVQQRSIKMSYSTPGASAHYDVSFKASSTPYTMTYLYVDFCGADTSASQAGDPIVGDSDCPDPPGFSLGAATFTSNPDGNLSNFADLSSCTGSAVTTSTHTNADTFRLACNPGVSITSGEIINFSVNTVTNPTYGTTGGVGTFYARAITYNSTQIAAGTATSTSYAAGGENSYQDYGGFALSTAQLINITAKIMEQLTFCTSGSSTPGTDPFTTPGCGDAVTPDLTLGHEVTAGGPHILDTSEVDFDQAYSLLSTNATNGAVVRMHATNTCTNGGLSATDGSSCDIPGIGSLLANAYDSSGITPGTAAFGMCVAPDDGATALSTIFTPYDNGGTTADLNACRALNSTTPDTTTGSASAVAFGMDTSTNTADPNYPSSVNATTADNMYGTKVVSTASAVHDAKDAYVFGATASDTTPAGIYMGGESLIATGTF